jgi:transposase
MSGWLGLVPKQMSGDRTILGRITKRGNRYLRTLFMQGARVILLRPANWAKHNFGLWLTAAAQRLHHNVGNRTSMRVRHGRAVMGRPIGA